MNVIRCDEPEYLIWKWRPEGQEVNSTSRENAIRYNSSLRVKDGEVAVFVYKQKDGTMQDFIYGPYDETIKTANFPVLSSIVGMAFGGESPFQAEIYFINLAGVVKINFGIPYFDVFDPRFLDFGVPMSAGGSITFSIDDPQKFIKAHRLINFSLDDLKQQVKDAIVRRVKSEITNVPEKHQIPVLQIERRLDYINDIVKPRIEADFEDFAVKLRRLDISRIDVDKSSTGYHELREVTAQQQTRTINAQTDVNVKNLHDTQAINAKNMEETLRIQREEVQRAQRLQTETQFIGAHALNRQSDVMQTAAQNLGGGGFGGGSGSSGINPAQFMTGMAVGGALGGQMAGMVNTMGQQMNNQWQQAAAQNMAGGATPPPMPGAAPAVQYMVAVNGQQLGPYTLDQLRAMAQQGQLTAATFVWAQGMPAWTPAGQVAELAILFAPPIPGGGATPPPMP
ncbi:MAG: SPFH domain-containing protein [Muribaculaceae bacterium]|nr:SPFH domain-containing protein [Muribaculaceae bacterium]